MLLGARAVVLGLGPAVVTPSKRTSSATVSLATVVTAPTRHLAAHCSLPQGHHQHHHHRVASAVDRRLLLRDYFLDFSEMLLSLEQAI